MSPAPPCSECRREGTSHPCTHLGSPPAPLPHPNCITHYIPTQESGPVQSGGLELRELPDRAGEGQGAAPTPSQKGGFGHPSSHPFHPAAPPRPPRVQTTHHRSP